MLPSKDEMVQELQVCSVADKKFHLTYIENFFQVAFELTRHIFSNTVIR